MDFVLVVFAYLVSWTTAEVTEIKALVESTQGKAAKIDEQKQIKRDTSGKRLQDILEEYRVVTLRTPIFRFLTPEEPNIGQTYFSPVASLGSDVTELKKESGSPGFLLHKLTLDQASRKPNEDETFQFFHQKDLFAGDVTKGGVASSVADLNAGTDNEVIATNAEALNIFQNTEQVKGSKATVFSTISNHPSPETFKQHVALGDLNNSVRQPNQEYQTSSQNFQSQDFALKGISPLSDALTIDQKIHSTSSSFPFQPYIAQSHNDNSVVINPPVQSYDNASQNLEQLNLRSSSQLQSNKKISSSQHSFPTLESNNLLNAQVNPLTFNFPTLKFCKFTLEHASTRPLLTPIQTNSYGKSQIYTQDDLLQNKRIHGDPSSLTISSYSDLSKNSEHQQNLNSFSQGILIDPLMQINKLPVVHLQNIQSDNPYESQTSFSPVYFPPSHNEPNSDFLETQQTYSFPDLSDSYRLYESSHSNDNIEGPIFITNELFSNNDASTSTRDNLVTKINTQENLRPSYSNQNTIQINVDKGQSSYAVVPSLPSVLPTAKSHFATFNIPVVDTADNSPDANEISDIFLENFYRTPNFKNPENNFVFMNNLDFDSSHGTLNNANSLNINNDIPVASSYSEHNLQSNNVGQGSSHSFKTDQSITSFKNTQSSDDQVRSTFKIIHMNALPNTEMQSLSINNNNNFNEYRDMAHNNQDNIITKTNEFVSAGPSILKVNSKHLQNDLHNFQNSPSAPHFSYGFGQPKYSSLYGDDANTITTNMFNAPVNSHSILSTGVHFQHSTSSKSQVESQRTKLMATIKTPPLKIMGHSIKNIPPSYASPKTVGHDVGNVPSSYAPPKNVGHFIRNIPSSYAPPKSVGNINGNVPSSLVPPKNVGNDIRKVPSSYASQSSITGSSKNIPTSYGPPKISHYNTGNSPSSHVPPKLPNGPSYAPPVYKPSQSSVAISTNSRPFSTASTYTGNKHGHTATGYRGYIEPLPVMYDSSFKEGYRGSSSTFIESVKNKELYLLLPRRNPQYEDSLLNRMFRNVMNFFGVNMNY